MALVKPGAGSEFLAPLTERIYSTFAPIQKARVLALMQGQVPPLADQIGKVIEVRDVLAHWIETVDEDTGEIKAFWRVVLANGEQAYQAASKGVRQSIGTISRFYGEPPWDPPLKLKVEQITTAKRRKYFVLSPV